MSVNTFAARLVTSDRQVFSIKATSLQRGTFLAQVSFLRFG